MRHLRNYFNKGSQKFLHGLTRAHALRIANNLVAQVNQLNRENRILKAALLLTAFFMVGSVVTLVLILNA